ncbi:MAG TPA: hypothetical protein ENH12_02390 [Proteobacteria bacterium]|nr:hypothetical protein [Pseudomonadota bacterium]
MKQVSEEVIENVIIRMDNIEEGDIPQLIDLMEGYNQRNIMDYILREIMEGPEGEGALSKDDHIGVFMLCLMTVVDCFDRDHLSWAS